MRCAEALCCPAECIALHPVEPCLPSYPPPCDAFKRIARPLHASAGLACGCCGHVYDPDKDGVGLHRTSTLRTPLASPRARYDREHRTLASPQGCPSMSWPTPGFARTAAAQRALTSPSSQPTARFRGRISRRAALHPGLRRAPSTHYEPAITSTRATPSARGARGQLLRTRSRRGLRKSARIRTLSLLRRLTVPITGAESSGRRERVAQYSEHIELAVLYQVS